MDQLKYDVIKEFEDGTALWYEPITDEVDGFVLRGPNDEVIKVWTENRF